MIRGVTVLIHIAEEVGMDGANRPIYNTRVEEVENVLITPLSSEAVLNELNLTGKTTSYELSIPKGDEHEWVNTTVEFFSEKYRTVGAPREFIEEMIPLEWNKKVKVERYG